MKQEIWKDIPGFGGRFMASSFGRIKSVFTFTKTGRRRVLGTILKPSINAQGRYILKLTGKTYKVHRLIAFTFHKNPLNKPQVNHKDLNPLNNHKDNLEWATAKENTNHAQANGRIPIAKPLVLVGEYPKRHKKIKNTNTGEVHNSAIEVAAMLGITVKSVRRQLSGERRCQIPYTYIPGEYFYSYEFI